MAGEQRSIRTVSRPYPHGCTKPDAPEGRALYGSGAVEFYVTSSTILCIDDCRYTEKRVAITLVTSSLRRRFE